MKTFLKQLWTLGHITRPGLSRLSLPGLITLAISIIGTPAAKAQGLITLLSPNTQYTAAQLDDIDMISTWNFQEDYSMVELDTFADFEENGYITFSIPDMDTSTFVGMVEMVENENDTSYFWSGSIVDEPGGYFCFGRNTNSTGGYIAFYDRFYSLLPIGGNKCVLVKHDLEKYWFDGCANEDTTWVARVVDECEDDFNTCAATIDVLYLITPEARAFLNTFDFWSLAVFSGIANSSINLAFQNSDIPNKRVRFKGVENFELEAGYDPNFNIGNDLNSLIGDQTAQSLRDQSRADIVVMLTNQGYPNIAGLAGSINTPKDSAFAIVEVPFMIGPRWTLAHEVTHLFGARHNRPANGGNDNADICSHGWQFEDDDDIERRTIHALLGALPPDPFTPDGRILHFSNPDVQFNGEDTGTEDDNNAKAIRNTACNIAGFYNADMSVVIKGPKYFCEGEETEPQTYSAEVTEPAFPEMPGQPPYSYEWTWSPSPTFDPAYYIGNTQSIVINDVLECPFFFLRVRVTGSENFSRAYSTWVNTKICEECSDDQFLSSGEGSGARDEEGSLARVPLTGQDGKGAYAFVFPNPSAGNPTLRFSIEEPSDIIIKTTSSKGVEVNAISLDQVSQGVHSVELEMNEAPAGVYFCKILGGKWPQTLKVVLEK